MISQLARLFRRYRARHMTIVRRGDWRLDDGQGTEQGTGQDAGQNAGQGDALVHVHALTLKAGQVVVSGTGPAARIELELGGRRRIVERDTGRGPIDPKTGFSLALPAEPGDIVLRTHLGGQSAQHRFPPPSALRRGIAAAVLLPGFAGNALRALPAVYRWYRFHDPEARSRVRDLLGLGPLVSAVALDPGFVRALSAEAPDPGPAGPGAPAVTIVVPVYNAIDLLPEVLRRAVDNTDLPWRLIVIDDASPDPAVAPWLAGWAARIETAHPGRLSVLRNETNLGFIGTVNRAFALARAADPDAPVVLLNSDAFVPPGWASRLVRPMLEDPAVASVTPMSNDAELMSVPVLCRRTVLPAGAGDAIDAAARRFAPGQGEVGAPTGVGFCMALAPHWLARVPEFDPAFGMGYGEEVDWAQKIVALGGRHVCLPGLFVEHRGGASFGSDEKRRLLAKNGALVSRRYPRFDADVQAFIGDDPLLTPRLALGLVWAGIVAKGDRVPVYLGHSMGGGAELDMARRIAADVAAQGAAVVLRVGGVERWHIELHTGAGVTRGATDDTATMQALIGLLPARRVIYSCGVGTAHPAELPGILLGLGQGAAHGIEVLMHDFFPLSPSYVLLDSDTVYRGVPRPGGEDRAHGFRNRDGSGGNLAEWRGAWAPLMAAAERIVVFSRSSFDIVVQAFPQTRDRLVERPHRLLTEITALDDVTGPPLARPLARAGTVIGVLGNIGAHKGAGVLRDLAHRAARRRDVDLVVIGTIDPAYRVAQGLRIHGPYDHDDIPHLARRYGVTCWLIPSVWPETFSFTTHEALATGLPVLCFDLGGQGDAVRAAMARGAPGAVVAPPAPPRGRQGDQRGDRRGDRRRDLDALLDLAGRLSAARRAAVATAMQEKIR